MKQITFDEAVQAFEDGKVVHGYGSDTPGYAQGNPDVGTVQKINYKGYLELRYEPAQGPAGGYEPTAMSTLGKTTDLKFFLEPKTPQ
jgi:hypothetical protein